MGNLREKNDDGAAQITFAGARGDSHCSSARPLWPRTAQQKEVRWGQWKGTEVGEKFMAELKAAFEKDHPDIKLVPVDSPFTGFHDRAIVLHQAKKLPDVLIVAGRLGCRVRRSRHARAARRADCQGAEGVLREHPVDLPSDNGGASSTTCRSRAAPSRCSTTPICSRLQASSGPPKTWDEFAEYARKLTNPDKRSLRRHGHAAGRAADQHDLRHLPALAPGRSED